MAWWDYGYEIIRLGRRVPVANPTQAGAEIAGRFFTATNEVEAARVLEEAFARYVIAHAELPILPRGPVLQGKFETLLAWAGKDISRYWGCSWPEMPRASSARSPSFTPSTTAGWP
jgi:AglB core domain